MANPDINTITPMTGRMMTESGEIVNIAELMAYIAGGAGDVKPTNYLYVGKNGNDTTGDGSANLPYLTIGKAFTVATSGTTIFCWPGTYAENLTFKAGVSLTAPVKFAVYVTGNHTANLSGTMVVENVILQSTTGITLTFSGTSSQNFQLLGSSVNSGSGDAINWTNTNSASKIYFEDGTCNVSTSGATARCFYSTTGSAGSVIANRVTFKLNNYDNVCLGIGGAISFTHTSDAVVGQMVIANTASLTSALCTHTTATTPVLTTTSSGMTMFLDCIEISTATPIITGAGAFSYSAVILPSTGAGSNSTLNGGIGSICLQMAPLKIRPGTLKPVVQDGLLEYDGTHLYFTIGTTRTSIL
jgi:hypothetical protein